MKIDYSKQNRRAITKIDGLAVIFVLAVLFAVLIGPNLNNTGDVRLAVDSNCVNNIKQINLACLIWSQDHGTSFPASVSINSGGAREWALTGNIAAIFQVMSNELSTPKILICPTDRNRTPAKTISDRLGATNISYFAGLDARSDTPNAFLCGDDNLATVQTPLKSGIVSISSDTLLGWTPGRHRRQSAHFWTAADRKFKGNVGLVDGSVQQVMTMELRYRLRQTGFATNRLVIP